MDEPFDPYQEWLGIPDGKPSTYYGLFGIELMIAMGNRNWPRQRVRLAGPERAIRSVRWRFPARTPQRIPA